jgi:RNA polymerase sigma-70 factor, ECF subfamily
MLATLVRCKPPVPTKIERSGRRGGLDGLTVGRIPYPAAVGRRVSSRLVPLQANASLDREAALKELLTAALEPSYRLAVLLLRDRPLAEEATHDAVVRALRSMRSLRDLCAFEPWFRRIVVNACRDAGRRRRGAELPLVDEIGPQLPDPSGPWIERAALASALAHLSLVHREVIALRFYADLPVEAIADTLGIRVGTAKSRLHYALRELRAEYDAGTRIR